MNILDEIIGFISPKAGAERARFRLIQDFFVRRYEAASISRRTSDWVSQSTSANTEIGFAASILRNRSRDLSRNNPHAKKAIATLVTNVVGNGIKPSIQSGGRYGNKTKSVWKMWAETTECDFEGRKTFAGIQAMAMRSVAESGECFIRERRSAKWSPLPIKLQVLEADFLDTNKDGIPREGGGFIMQGIEHNAQGERVAYWMYEYHPGENRIHKSMESRRIPADEILHIYYAERPGQIRGVPVGVSSMLRLKSLDEYEDAELMRKKVASCFGAFVTTTEDALPGEANDTGGPPIERLEPGMIEYLKPGQTVSLASPPPSDGYGEYVTSQLRSIASGYGVTYESMSGDYSQVNFSSGRMGWIEMGNIVGEYQELMMIPVLCSGVWKWFLRAATMAGVAKMDVFATWTSPRRPMLDPVKETKGLSERVRNGFTSWQDAIREQGDDPETVQQELAADYEAFAKLGFMLTCDPRYDPNRVKQQAESGSPPVAPKPATKPAK